MLPTIHHADLIKVETEERQRRAEQYRLAKSVQSPRQPISRFVAPLIEAVQHLSFAAEQPESNPTMRYKES